jgi:hypothetical protein
MNIAERALDSQPLGPHRGEVRAACDEMNVGAGLLESRAEKAADASGTYDRNFHRVVTGAPSSAFRSTLFTSSMIFAKTCADCSRPAAGTALNVSISV